MVLEKNKALRKVEFIFTDDQIHEVAFYEFDNKIMEDGVMIQSQKSREQVDYETARTLVNSSDPFVQ